FAIDPDQLRVIATIETGGRPRSVAFSRDGSRAFVACENGGYVAVVDAREHKLLAKIQLPTGSLPMGTVVSAEGKELYVSTAQAVLRCSPADVIRITFAQLAREAVCFLGVTRLAKCHRGFVQRARSDGWIVIKQSDAFESFAGVIEVPALELDFAREQARFSVHAALGLEHHDFFGNLLRLVRLMSADLNSAERQ